MEGFSRQDFSEILFLSGLFRGVSRRSASFETIIAGIKYFTNSFVESVLESCVRIAERCAKIAESLEARWRP